MTTAAFLRLDEDAFSAQERAIAQFLLMVTSEPDPGQLAIQLERFGIEALAGICEVQLLHRRSVSSSRNVECSRPCRPVRGGRGASSVNAQPEWSLIV
jgi:hypothetical protein